MAEKAGNKQGWVALPALLAVTFVLIFFGGRPGHAACRALAKTDGYGAYGVADGDGRMIDACNPDQALMPASVLKIVTALAAHHILGDTYRFRTEFYVDGRDNLYVKGFGDPMLVTEEIAGIVEQLGQLGLRRVHTLYVDTSAFVLTTQVPGRGASANPYDAPVGPLSVNFNSAYLHVDTLGTVRSAEPQTPLLPMFRELGRGLPPGRHRINVCGGGECDPEAQMAQYGSELLQTLLEEAGIPVAAVGGIREVPRGQEHLVYTHLTTRSLAEINTAMLQYSSNVIANLLYLTCGAERYGYPATWEKAQQAVTLEMARLLGEKTAAALIQVEGSGLSRQNRVTVRSMLCVLEKFRPHADLLMQQGGVFIKTGTMTGVSASAGYLAGDKPFVILLNESTNDRTDVLKWLEARHNRPVR